MDHDLVSCIYHSLKKEQDHMTIYYVLDTQEFAIYFSNINMVLIGHSFQKLDVTIMITSPFYETIPKTRKQINVDDYIDGYYNIVKDFVFTDTKYFIYKELLHFYPEKNDQERVFSNGECLYFALVFHHYRTTYDIMVLSDRNGPIHCFLKKGNKYVDIYGVQSESEFLDRWTIKSKYHTYIIDKFDTTLHKIKRVTKSIWFYMYTDYVVSKFIRLHEI